MAVTSGFFNSINGDRKYNAQQIGMYLGALVSSGVVPNPSTSLQVTAAGGMAVQVWPGRGMADCHWIDNDSMYTLILDDADLILDRIDAVVMRLDESDDAREVCITVKKGTPASSPEVPAMERTEKVEEYCLAQIYVPKIKDDGTQEIIQANITDTRADTEVCGWVTSRFNLVDSNVKVILDRIDARLTFLELAQTTGVTKNKFSVTFEGLDKIEANGIWDTALKRICF